MHERALWHPVASTEAVAEQPVALRLLGEELVLWRDHSKMVHAWADQCPHRGARLSMGRVLGDHFECAYHGWQFDCAARLVKVPALPDYRPPATHRACRFEAIERYDLVWVRLNETVDSKSAIDPFRQSPPAFAAEHEARLRKVNSGPYDVQTSAPRIVENFLDLAHFGFVHEHWLGARERPEIADYQLEPTATGFIATYCAVLTKIPESGSTGIADFRESIALFVCPIEPEFSRVWFRLAMNDFSSADAKLIAFQDTIFNQDRPVLESQRPKRLPLDPKAELHSAADKSSAAYRRVLRNWGISFGVC
jgi:phenylpropionate dioxygenase-like ring-hydroxylating dioxygenase large terminal subunit